MDGYAGLPAAWRRLLRGALRRRFHNGGNGRFYRRRHRVCYTGNVAMVIQNPELLGARCEFSHFRGDFRQYGFRPHGAGNGVYRAPSAAGLMAVRGGGFRAAISPVRNGNDESDGFGIESGRRSGGRCRVGFGVVPKRDAGAGASPAAPANVRSANGSAVGQAVVRWDAVADAAYYRIGWVNMETFQAVRAGMAGRVRFSRCGQPGAN